MHIFNISRIIWVSYFSLNEFDCGFQGIFPFHLSCQIYRHKYFLKFSHFIFIILGFMLMSLFSFIILVVCIFSLFLLVSRTLRRGQGLPCEASTLAEDSKCYPVSGPDFSMGGSLL